jgi:hypothetical protein
VRHARPPKLPVAIVWPSSENASDSTKGLGVNTYETISGRIGDLEFVKGTPLLAILASDRRLHLYDTKDQQEIRNFNTHILTDGVLARSDNGRFLAVGSGPEPSVDRLAVVHGARHSWDSRS